MSVYKMSQVQFAQFTKATEAKVIDSFLAPTHVRVLATDGGTVVVLEHGDGNTTVIGDSVGVYWGPDTPDYLS